MFLDVIQFLGNFNEIIPGAPMRVPPPPREFWIRHCEGDTSQFLETIGQIEQLV